MPCNHRLLKHIHRKHGLKLEGDSKYMKIISLAKVISASAMMPQALPKMKEESENSLDESLDTLWAQAEERQNSRDSSFPKDIVSSQSSDVNESGEEGSSEEPNKSSKIESEVDESANIASQVLSRFHRWLLSPDGEKKDAKTVKQHVAQVKRVLSILGNGGKVESLLVATNIRDVFLGEHTSEKYHPATIKSYLHI